MRCRLKRIFSPYNVEICLYQPRDERFFINLNHHKFLSWSFPLQLNIYVTGLRQVEIFYSFSARIDFRRQILTSKVGPRAERVK